MRKNFKESKEANLPSFCIIKAATAGDVVSINSVLKHYEGYMRNLSTRRFYDESRRLHYCVDETLRRHLETKLITKILEFKPCVM